MQEHPQNQSTYRSLLVAECWGQAGEEGLEKGTDCHAARWAQVPEEGAKKVGRGVGTEGEGEGGIGTEGEGQGCRDRGGGG